MRLLLHGGPVYAPSAPGADALLAVDGQIVWIGPSAGAARHGDAAEVVVDLDGAFVAPAFVDAHVHHTATGLALLGLDLLAANSRVELLEALRARAGELKGRPVVGRGWDETRWEDSALPSRQELDSATRGSVVCLWRVDGHSTLVSSAMIDLVPHLRSLSGFDDSGHLTDQAHQRVSEHLREHLPDGLREAAQRATREHAAAAGVAALHEAGGPTIQGEQDLLALIELASSSRGPELVAYWGQAGGPVAAQRLGADGAGGDLFVDGSLGSRTALLRSPYADRPGSVGVGHVTAADVEEHLVACTRSGVQAGFHAIGDAALDIVVHGLHRTIERCGPAPVRACRHRVEHLTMATPEHVAVLAEAGAVASVQPVFDSRWGAPGGAYSARLGPDRAAGLHDFAGMVRAGVSLAFGSDSPVTTIEPWEWVRAAMWHHRPQARLSGRAAFAAATRGGWRAARRDDSGVLAVGAPATFAIWDVDELAVQSPATGVANWSTDPRSGTPGLPVLDRGAPAPQCLATVLAGDVIHAADDDVATSLVAGGAAQH